MSHKPLYKNLSKKYLLQGGNSLYFCVKNFINTCPMQIRFSSISLCKPHHRVQPQLFIAV